MPKELENLDDANLPGSVQTPGGSLEGSGAAPPPPRPVRHGRLRRLRQRFNSYLAVFVLLIIAALAVVLATYHSNKNNNQVNNVGSLTSQQLAQLNGNTTLVGDSKQTLDVQSNSIFEGQVLLRSDLNVAGAIKVGGGLSLSSISTSGAGNFGQLGVSGDTSLQGQLSVQKNLSVAGSGSFGSLSAAQLNVTSLQLTGNLSLSQHVVTSGGNPRVSFGPALGGGGTASVSGSDTAGTVAINTGSNPPAGCLATVNFVRAYSATPHVVISPSNSAAAGLAYYTNRGSGSFSVCSASGPAGGTNYLFDYIVFD